MFAFPDNLKNARERKGISRAELARRLDITPQGYGKYELGTGQPDLETLAAIADTLNISIDELLGHKVNPLQWAEDFAQLCDFLPFSSEDTAFMYSTATPSKSTERKIEKIMEAHKGKRLLFLFHNGNADEAELLAYYTSEQDFISAMQRLESKLMDCMKAVAPHLAKDLLLADIGENRP